MRALKQTLKPFLAKRRRLVLFAASVLLIVGFNLLHYFFTPSSYLVRKADKSNNFDVGFRCLDSGLQGASCVLYDAYYATQTFYYHCVGGDCPDLPLCSSYPRQDRPFRQGEHVFKVVNQTDGWLPRSYGSHVFILLTPFWLPNIGHVLGDDLFSIYRALSLFGLEKAHKITVVSTTPVKQFSERAIEVYTTASIELTSLAELDRFTFPVLVHGLSGLSYGDKLARGGGLVLDSYREWYLQRAGLTKEVAVRPLTFTIIRKDYDVAVHPQGPANTKDVLAWIREDYPDAAVTHTTLSVLKYREQVKLLSSTDILIVGPGSDYMISLFLRNFKAVLMIPLCLPSTVKGMTCEPSLGQEHEYWYQFRGSIFFVSYDDVHDEDIINATGDCTKECLPHRSYFKVVVRRKRFMQLLQRAVRFVRSPRVL